MKRKIIAIAALALIAAAVAFLAARNQRGADGVLRVSGNIEITSVEASFRIPGRVKERLVDEGAMVKTGEIIARLDQEELTNEVALRQAQVENASQGLAELEAGSRKEEIAQAEAALARTRAEANRLDTDYARVKTLYAREVVPKRELDTAKAAHESSQAMVREAAEALKLLRSGPRKERIAQARARLKESTEALNESRTRLSYAVLAAPMPGLVISKHIEAGEQVNAGTPVITIGDMENTWLRAYIPETDLGKIKVGQKVRVKTDTYPGRVYNGNISFIASEAEFTPKNVQTEKERVKLVYRIKITIPNPRMELKPGMPADAEILTDGKN